MEKEKKKSIFSKEDFDSPVTKEMRRGSGMNDDGHYANMDYKGRDTASQTKMKEEFAKNPHMRKIINAKANYLRHQARLNVYRKSVGHSNNPAVQQHHQDHVSAANNRLAKEKMNLHHIEGALGEDNAANPNYKEVVKTMTMATGKPNLGEDPTANLKAKTNVNSDVWKNKWDKNEW